MWLPGIAIGGASLLILILVSSGRKTTAVSNADSDGTENTLKMHLGEDGAEMTPSSGSTSSGGGGTSAPSVRHSTGDNPVTSGTTGTNQSVEAHKEMLLEDTDVDVKRAAKLTRDVVDGTLGKEAETAFVHFTEQAFTGTWVEKATDPLKGTFIEDLGRRILSPIIPYQEAEKIVDNSSDYDPVEVPTAFPKEYVNEHPPVLTTFEAGQLYKKPHPNPRDAITHLTEISRNSLAQHDPVHDDELPPKDNELPPPKEQPHQPWHQPRIIARGRGGRGGR